MVRIGFLAALLILPSFTFQGDKTVIYLVGDSTCADKNPDAFPETGWGTPFKTFFDETVEIANRAKNGRSTKSFLQEGLWEDVLKTLKKGDYVFIQFGHNDEVPSKTDRYTTPEQFTGNLKRYVKETQSKGAIPILLTPVTRRSFENGVLIDSHKEYAQLTRNVANEMNVLLIDMTTQSMVMVDQWGMENSKLLYHHLVPNEHPNFPNGKEDDTHFSELGARKMAQLVLSGIRESDLDLNSKIVIGKR